MPRPDALQRLLDFSRSGDSPFVARPLHIRSAPARLDVLGALGADTGGTLAHIPLRSRIAVALQPREDPTAIFSSDLMQPPLGEPTLHLPPDGSRADASWAAPLLAAWQRLRPQSAPPGLTAVIRSDIPMNAGQGSSTALLAAFTVALTDLYQLSPDAPQLAALIADAEQLSPATPSTANYLTALTCLTAQSSPPAAPAVIRYNAQPHERLGEIPLPPDVHLLALDTGVRYTRTVATLDELRVAADMGRRIIETIYRDLGQSHTPLHGYLANTSPLLYRQYFRTLLPRRMRASDFTRTYGPLSEPHPSDPAAVYRVRTAVDHLIAENEHAEQFIQAFEELAAAPSGMPLDDAERQRTLQRAGRLLLASHHSYRLRLELSCREADWLVDKLMEAGPDQGIYGARITGCGGGGTVALLAARSSPANDALLDTRRAYHQITGLTLAITEATNTPGALHSQSHTIPPHDV
jgi:L-arabinokinase